MFEGRLCWFKLKVSKKNTELTELLGLEPVSMVIKRGDCMRWFGHGHVERTDDGDIFELINDDDDDDWVKRCMAMETQGTGRPWRGRPRRVPGRNVSRTI